MTVTEYSCIARVKRAQLHTHHVMSVTYFNLDQVVSDGETGNAVIASIPVVEFLISASYNLFFTLDTINVRLLLFELITINTVFAPPPCMSPDP